MVLIPPIMALLVIASAIGLVAFAIYEILTVDKFLESPGGLVLMVSAIMMVILSIALSSLKLKIIVTYDSLQVGLFKGRVVSLNDIHSVTAEDFSPMKDYFGWGIRVGRKGVGYIAAGTKKGLRINLNAGKSFFISSKRTFEFESAMNTVLKAKKNSSRIDP
jgi:hypothetical protein